MKLATLTLLLFAATLSPAQIAQGHATGSDYAIVNTPVGWWSMWDPFRIQNRGPNPVQLIRIYARGIKTCLYDDNGQHCGDDPNDPVACLDCNFQIHTSCGYAQGGKFVLPTYLFPMQGCDNWFLWRPNFAGVKAWAITFEAVDAITGADESFTEVTGGKGCADVTNCWNQK
jgi:hypothetical protein